MLCLTFYFLFDYFSPHPSFYFATPRNLFFITFRSVMRAVIRQQLGLWVMFSSQKITLIFRFVNSHSKEAVKETAVLWTINVLISSKKTFFSCSPRTIKLFNRTSNFARFLIITVRNPITLFECVLPNRKEIDE